MDIFLFWGIWNKYVKIQATELCSIPMWNFGFGKLGRSFMETRGEKRNLIVFRKVIRKIQVHFEISRWQQETKKSWPLIVLLPKRSKRMDFSWRTTFPLHFIFDPVLTFSVGIYKFCLKPFLIWLDLIKVDNHRVFFFWNCAVKSRFLKRSLKTLQENLTSASVLSYEQRRAACIQQCVQSPLMHIGVTLGLPKASSQHGSRTSSASVGSMVQCVFR